MADMTIEGGTNSARMAGGYGVRRLGQGIVGLAARADGPRVRHRDRRRRHVYHCAAAARVVPDDSLHLVEQAVPAHLDRGGDSSDQRFHVVDDETGAIS